jgi:hypothetical protein
MIIGFAGLIGAGKSTLAQGLATKLNVQEPHINSFYRRLSFADPIKECLASINVTKESNLPLYRKMAQFIGNTAREANPDHWINEWLKRKSTSTNVIVDDVRYLNEFKLISSLGLLIYVYRPDSFDLSNPVFNHESEQLNAHIARIINTPGVNYSLSRNIESAANYILSITPEGNRTIILLNNGKLETTVNNLVSLINELSKSPLGLKREKPEQLMNLRNNDAEDDGN